jgi:hypothetical protein
MHYAPVNCNHAPPWSGGVPVIAGEMCRVFTFPMSPQCGGNVVVLFSRQNSTYRGAGAFGGDFTKRLSPQGGDFTWVSTWVPVFKPWWWRHCSSR